MKIKIRMKIKIKIQRRTRSPNYLPLETREFGELLDPGRPRVKI